MSNSKFAIKRIKERENNPEIWDAANVRFCLVEKPGLVANGRYNGTFDKDYSLELYHFGFSSL